MACGGLFLTCSAAISFSLATTAGSTVRVCDGRGRRDLQRDVAHELPEFVIRHGGFLPGANFDENPDLAPV